MNGFRSLAEGEVVEFETKDSFKGAEATLVTGPGGSECQGGSSHQQRRQGTGDSKNKKSRKIRSADIEGNNHMSALIMHCLTRCYNCGELSSHVASTCTMAPQPKRCHQCKSTDHLIADCPLAVPKSKPRAPEAP